jgi:hypothetical protein
MAEWGGGGSQQILGKVTSLAAASPPFPLPPPLLYTGTFHISNLHLLPYNFHLDILKSTHLSTKSERFKVPAILQCICNISRLTFKMVLQKTHKQANLRRTFCHCELFPPGIDTRGF